MVKLCGTTLSRGTRPQPFQKPPFLSTPPLTSSLPSLLSGTGESPSPFMSQQGPWPHQLASGPCARSDSIIAFPFKPFCSAMRSGRVLYAWILYSCMYIALMQLGNAQCFNPQNCAAVVLVIASAPTYILHSFEYTLQSFPSYVPHHSFQQYPRSYRFFANIDIIIIATLCAQSRRGRAVPLFTRRHRAGVFILRGHRSQVGIRLIQALSVKIEGFCGRGLQRVLEVDTEVRRIAVIQPRCHLSRLGYLNLCYSQD